MSLGEVWLRSKTSSDAIAVRSAMVVVVLWVVTGVKSCEEIRYSMGGQVVAAQVVKVSDRSTTRRPRTLTYQWIDSATQKLRKATTPLGDNAPVPSAIDIIYLPGTDGLSMPVVQRSIIWPILFFGSTLAAIVAFIWLGRSLTRT